MAGSAITLAARTAALRCCRLFESLPPVELASIAEFSVLKQVLRGAFIFREGEPTSGFFIVRSGAVNVHRISAEGREKTIRIFRSGESFAEATLADGTGYPAHCDYDRYEGEYGIHDVKKAIETGTLHGITTHAFAIEKQAAEYFPRLFTRGKFDIIPRPEALTRKLCTLFASTLAG